MNTITLEEKRQLSKILKENIVEEDDATAMAKLTELFKNCVTADMVMQVINNLPEEEKTKVLDQINSKEETTEEAETADNAESEVESKEETQAETTEEVTEEENVEASETESDAVEEEVPTEETSETEDKEVETEETSTEEKTEETETSEETPETEAETTEEAVSEVANEQPNNDELFDAKLEAALLRANVREDRLDSAKKLFKADHTIDDISKVASFVKEYPEWTKHKSTSQAKPFGMEVGASESAETAEEKRLKELGW